MPTEDEIGSQKFIPLIDILFVLIAAWIHVVAREKSGNELVGAIGRVFVMGLAIRLIWWRGGSWQTIGIARPKSILKTILQGIGLLMLGFVVVGGAQAILINLPGATYSDLSRFNSVQGNLPLLLFWLVTIWTTIAFSEEIVWRAFLMERLATLFGSVPYRGVLTVIISAVMFGLFHYYQGLMGIVLSGLLGLIYATVYLLGGRNLWVLIIAHGLSDTLSFIQLYLGRLQSLFKYSQLKLSRACNVTLVYLAVDTVPKIYAVVRNDNTATTLQPKG